MDIFNYFMLLFQIIDFFFFLMLLMLSFEILNLSIEINLCLDWWWSCRKSFLNAIICCLKNFLLNQLLLFLHIFDNLMLLFQIIDLLFLFMLLVLSFKILNLSIKINFGLNWSWSCRKSFLNAIICCLKDFLLNQFLLFLHIFNYLMLFF